MAIGMGGLGPGRAGINVTPLIDVLLVLLVIFIMVAPVLTKAMQSELPVAADTPLSGDHADRQVFLFLGKDGRLWMNGLEVERHSLATKLGEAWMPGKGHPDEAAVFLDADAEAGYGAVIELMDFCRDAGASVIGLVPDGIEPPPD